MTHPIYRTADDVIIGVAETFQPYIERGELVPLLEDYCPPFAGLYLYYASRHRQPSKLRALIDHVRIFHKGLAKTYVRVLLAAIRKPVRAHADSTGYTHVPQRGGIVAPDFHGGLRDPRGMAVGAR